MAGAAGTLLSVSAQPNTRPPMWPPDQSSRLKIHACILRGHASVAVCVSQPENAPDLGDVDALAHHFALHRRSGIAHCVQTIFNPVVLGLG